MDELLAVSMLDFLLVIPTVNESQYMGDFITEAEETLGRIYKDYRIVIADASADDSTTRIAESLNGRYGNIDIIAKKKKGRRGLDVLDAMKKYKSKVYCYIDADLKPSLPHIGSAVGKMNGNCDVVIGSRYIDGGILERPLLRKEASLLYNSIIRSIFGDGIKDHQCGFKFFNQRSLEIIKRHSEEKHWVWDTEVILIASSSGLRMAEVPIRWIERRSKKTNLYRLLYDTYVFLPGILRLVWRFRLSKKDSLAISLEEHDPALVVD